MRVALLLIGAPLFLCAGGLWIYMRIVLRVRDDLDDVYYEFEHTHPKYARYLHWERRILMLACLAALLLFLALVF